METSKMPGVVLFWYISVACCYNFHTNKKTFNVSSDKQIVNNHLYSLEASNAIECGIKCSEDDRCSASTYNAETYECSLHFTGIFNPCNTEVKNGVVTLTEKGKDIPFDIRFDRDTLYQNRFMSSDGTVLSNSLSNSVRAWPKGNNPLINYRGAVSKQCVAPGQKIYYEFQFDYELSVTFHAMSIVFDIGVADKSTIDNDLTAFCGAANVDGWSFTIRECVSGNICISAWRNGIKEFETPISSSKIGTFATGIYGLMLDRIDNSFSMFHKASQSLIYAHTNVISNANLCSIIGIADLEYSNTTIKLLSANEIQTTP